MAMELGWAWGLVWATAWVWASDLVWDLELAPWGWVLATASGLLVKEWG